MINAAASTEQRHLPELNGVRGLAALLVIYAHLFLMWIPDQPTWLFWARSFSGQAWTGVYLFFLLSGFLIGGILLRHRTAENYYSVFYTRRAFRIFPLYFLLLGSFLVVRSIFAGTAPAEFAQGPVPLGSYFALLQNFPMAVTGQWGAAPLAVTWSVALEEQFYLFLPLWIRAIPPQWHAVSFLFLAAIGPVFRGLSSCAYPPFLVPGSMEGLFLGVFMAWLHINRPTLFQSLRCRRILTLLLAATAGGIALISTHRNFGAFTITVITLFWAAFLALVIGSMGTRSTSWLRSAFLCWIGRISYGLYLFHPMVLGIVFLVATGGAPKHALGIKGFLLSLLTFAITLGLASLFFYGFERYLIARGRRIRYRQPKKPPMLETLDPVEEPTWAFPR